MIKCSSIIVLAASLAGCAAPVKQFYIRGDGQPLASSPALEQQFQMDSTVCLGEQEKANMSGVQLCRGTVDCLAADIGRAQSAAVVGKGCMAQKGYVLVPEPEVSQRQAEFRANAQHQKQAKR